MSHPISALLCTASLLLACSGHHAKSTTTLEPQSPAASPQALATTLLRQPDAACTVHARPGCFYLEHDGGQDCWVPRSDLGYETCAALNACTESEGGLSGAECYKWSGSSDSPASDWRRAEPWGGERATTWSRPRAPQDAYFYDDEGCFVQSPDESPTWRPVSMLSRDACQALDACTPHGGGLSDGLCHKWAAHSAAAPTRWPQPWPEDTIPEGLRFDRSSVQPDFMLAYAEANHQPVTPLIIIKSVWPSGAYAGHAARVRQQFHQGVRYEHTPTDIDGSGTVSLQLTLPEMTDAEVRVLIESFAQQLNRANTTYQWVEPSRYVGRREVGEHSFSFARSAGQITIRFSSAAC